MSEILNIPPFVPVSVPGFDKKHAEIKAFAEDFCVDEIGPEEGDDTGPHIRFRIEKRGLTTEEVLFHIAKELGIDKEAIGVGGLKDKQAVTTQYLTVSHELEPRLDALEYEGLRVLEVCGRSRKLKRGHLGGNAFSILLRGTQAEDADSLLKALSYLATEGIPNAYGPQRFGHQMSTWEMGHKLLLEGEQALADLPRQKKRFMRRLAINAVQSGIFNTWLLERQRDELLSTVLQGDVLWVERLGTPQLALDPAAEQKRLESFKVSLTGPMFGVKMRAAVGKASTREKLLLGQYGLKLQHFAPFAKIAPGSRRPALIYPKKVGAKFEPDGVRVSFELPPGAYATVVLDALVQSSKI
jgi:tRNA pseudouridine13 synthase